MIRALPFAVATVVLAMVSALVVLAPGYPVRKLDLNDSGIWVTNNAEALYGRLNKSVESLDGLVGPAGGVQAASTFSLDVLQDGAHVVARDLMSGRVTPVDVAEVVHDVDRGVTLDPASVIDMRGGTVAVLNPTTGQLWAGRYSQPGAAVDLSTVDANADPVAELGEAIAGAARGGDVSVGVDGTVHAVSSNGTRVTIRPDGAGLGEPALSEGEPLGSIQITAIGDEAATLGLDSGVLQLPGGGRHQLDADPLARLQAASVESQNVVLATSVGLLSASGSGITTLGEGNGNAPAQPMVLAGCAFAAWPGDPGLVMRSCDGEPAEVQPGLDEVPLVAPVFRANRGQILLNDSSDGKVYSFEQQQFVDNWEETQPLPATEDGDPEQRARPQDEEPPQANNDTIGARPGRTTVAHVLDNDTDAVGRVLTITAVTQPGGAEAKVAPDGQTILVTLPENASNTSFEYTLSNGSHTDSAQVRVEVRSEAQNGAPELRLGAQKRSYAVSSWGTITVPAVGDWRDPDGDPVALHSIRSEPGRTDRVGLTTDNRIGYTAVRSEQTVLNTVQYYVTDQRSELIEASFDMTVLAFNATQGAAPLPEPDAVRGEVGRPIVARPLANDVPGADPLNPRATLELAAPVQGPDELTIDTDLRTGEVSVVARSAGTYFLEYTAKFGSAQFAQGQIRVDAAEPGDSTPTAVPDDVVIRGQAGVMVDVLANDADPSGSLLTVLSARVRDVSVDGSPEMQAAVLKGRWLRVMPIVEEMRPSSQVIEYTISNGRSAPVTGSVTVTQLPRTDEDRASVHDDFAVVRAGDSVLVPVLANDHSTSGAQLVLDRNIPEMPGGQLRVTDANEREGVEVGEVGSAYVVNDQVRYLAPAEVETQRQMRVEYQAYAPDGTPETGILNVTVNPAPSDERPNVAPRPQNLEARASAGQTIEIPIEPWGQDPDGDTVAVLGIASAPRQGRVLSFTPNAIIYQAYPSEGNGGTDSFRYRVTDAFGASETGLVRVAITEPGAVQVPVAVADSLTAVPGADVQIHALSNDMFDDVDPPTIVPFDQMGNEVPEGVSLGGEDGPILALTPGIDAVPLRFAYALQNSGGVGPAAEVVVRSQPGYLNPPRTYDEVAKAEGTVATVDVLRRAWDPDGATAALRVSSIAHADATLEGGTITIPLLERPQVVTYVVTDATDASSSSVVFVPAAGEGLPYLRADGDLEMAPDSTFAFDINDYVISPRGTPVSITVAESLAASPGQVSVAPDSASRLTLTSSDGYTGPGAVVFEVRDGETDDPLTQTTYISIPVQVGSATPVLRCPPWTQSLVQGGASVNLRISAVCTIWTPDPAQAALLDVTSEWGTPIRDVSAAANGQVVTVEAGSTSNPGDTGVLRVAIAGFPETAKDINIQVTAATKPRLVVSDITDVKQGTVVTQTIQLSSPLKAPQPTVVRIEQTAGMPAQAKADGNRFTVTPDGDSHGTMTFKVTASDMADASRIDRHVEASLTVTVYGRPDKPQPPQPDMVLRSKVASVSYAPPPDNGAPILAYQVMGGGRTVDCGRATRCEITGLQNGTPVTFQVRAQNKADWSEWSEAGPAVTPDEVPGKVPTFSTSHPADGQLTLNWAPAQNEGSAVTQYLITYGGTTVPVSGSATSHTVQSLNNNAVYTFTILAQNAAGVSKEPTSTTGQSSGRPVMSSVSVRSADLGATAQVTASWPAADPQGPRPVTYAVTRTGGSAGPRTWTGITGTSLGDSVTYDGTTYTYAVTATNATGGAAHTSAPVGQTITATGRPAAWGAISATATGSNGAVQLSYTVPPSRGSSSVVTLHGAGAVRSMSAGSGTSATSFSNVPLTGLTNGQSYSLYLRVCNEANACTQSGATSVTPYGPLADPTLNVSVSGRTVTWSASGSGNGRNAQLSVSGAGSQSSSGAGSISVGPVTSDAGWNASVTVTATLSDPAGGRTARTVTRAVTTGPPPPPPKTVTVWQGSQIGSYPTNCAYGHYQGGQCTYIGYTTSGFGGETYTCTIANGSGYNFSVRDTHTGDVRFQSAAYNGENTTIHVTCGGVRGSRAW